MCIRDRVLFFRINKPGGDYRYKCFRYSYLGSDTDTIIVEAQDMHELRLIQLKEEESNRRLMATALKEAKDMVEMRRNFLAILTREVMAPVQYVSAELYKQENLQERIGEIRTAAEYVPVSYTHLDVYKRQGSLFFRLTAWVHMAIIKGNVVC